MSISIRANRQRGATKVELVVVTIIVSVLCVWLLHTLRFYQELTEKTVVESTIVNLRSGLRFKIADLIIKGTPERQTELLKTNPIALLDSPPNGYMGEMRTPKNVPPGTWYYEQDKGELVYIPKMSTHLALTDGTQPDMFRLRWQIRMNDENKGAPYLDVVAMNPFVWF